MKSAIHGIVTPVPLASALTATDGRQVRYSKLDRAETASATSANVFRFGRLLPALVNQRLPDRPGMAADLFKLAQSMQGGDRESVRDAKMAAIYTYLGQFIDHDITRTEMLPGLASNMEAAFHVARVGKDISPLDAPSMQLLVNGRNPTLNLDSVLSTDARDDRGALLVGPVTEGPPRPTLPFDEPAEIALLHDLPRLGKSANEDTDRRARIGDPRNDENLVVAQLHVAYLRTHRRLVHEFNFSASQADLELQRLHQSIVVNDYLPTVCMPEVVKAVLESPTGVFYKPTAEDPFMPLEFSVAAFRFGHSQVRNAYDYNSEFSGQGGKPIALLADLFTFTAFSGQNFDLDTLPQNWIIDWSRWVQPDNGSTPLNLTRRVDTLLATKLMDLPQHQGVIGGSDVNILAVRNLVRGYLLGLPTGQAVAAAVHQKLGDVIKPLTQAHLHAIAEAADADGGNGQLAALTGGGFDVHTPLWYYTLAEASLNEDGRLGSVGSFIVADVLVQLVRLSQDNYLASPDWRPAIPTFSAPEDRRVMINDLLRFAQLLPPAA